jgi:hypothetical protein
MKIIEMENKMTLVQTKNENCKELIKHEVNYVQDKNKKLEGKLMKSIEQYKKCKAYALEQKAIVEKTNEVNEMKNEEHKKVLEEMELLKTELNEKEIQINNKNESIGALTKQIGCLSYQLSMVEERDQQYKSLEKEY